MKATLLVCTLLAVSLSAFAQSAKDEQTIRHLDQEWSQAAQSKNLDKTISFYATDASVLPFNAPIATGTSQIHDIWQHLMSAPGFSLTFAPTKIEVSKSGDMAYEIGTFELKMNDASGTPTTTPGKYVVTWKKIGGHWKVEADIFNTNK